VAYDEMLAACDWCRTHIGDGDTVIYDAGNLNLVNASPHKIVIKSDGIQSNEAYCDDLMLTVTAQD